MQYFYCFSQRQGGNQVAEINVISNNQPGVEVQPDNEDRNQVESEVDAINGIPSTDAQPDNQNQIQNVGIENQIDTEDKKHSENADTSTSFTFDM